MKTITIKKVIDDLQFRIDTNEVVIEESIIKKDIQSEQWYLGYLDSMRGLILYYEALSNRQN